jgi:hypothetical protein
MVKKGEGNRTAKNMVAPGTPPEVEALVRDGGDSSVWIREDGAVCFGNECAVIKPGADSSLDLEIKPDRCGREQGALLLDYLIRTAGAGVNIRIPPRESLGDKK